MLNNVMANGSSLINLRTNLRIHRSRQKQNDRYLKILILFFLVVTLIMFYINMGIPGPDEQLIYLPVIVQHGDTLWGLAKKTGLQMDTGKLVQKIMVYNSLANSTIIPGQTIYIPALM